VRQLRFGQVPQFQHFRSAGRGHGNGFHVWNSPFLTGAVTQGKMESAVPMPVKMLQSRQ
jgi:hypothetical protein